MKELVEKFLDDTVYQRIISRAVGKLLSFGPQGLRKYASLLAKFLYAAFAGCLQRLL